MRTEQVDVNGTKYLVTIHYEQRNGSRVSIGKKGINICVPLGMSRDEQSREVLKMKIWAKEQLLKKPEKFKKEPAKEYHDGDVLTIGHDEYHLHIDFKEKQSSSARRSDKDIYLFISSSLSKERQNEHVSTLLSRVVARKRIDELKGKISQLNDKHFHQKLNKIFFKYNSSNWGSCSINGNINISTRLLFAPEDVLEYVCIHELAHLIEHNHSDRFWKLVEDAMPNYKEKKQWLKEHGQICTF